MAGNIRAAEGGAGSSRPLGQALLSRTRSVLTGSLEGNGCCHLILLIGEEVTAGSYWPLDRFSWQEAFPSGGCGVGRGLACVWSRGSPPRVGPCPSGRVADSATGWIFPKNKQKILLLIVKKKTPYYFIKKSKNNSNEIWFYKITGTLW